MNFARYVPMHRLRRKTLRFARTKLGFVGDLTRRIWPQQGDEDSVLYRGQALPPRALRSQMCGECFRLDSFFLESAVVEATRLSASLGYTRGSRVVDVGSGLGRLAIGMIAEFGEADYLGFDAYHEYVEWCQNAIERDHPGFKFVHLDVVNDLYNPGGRINGERIVFPVADKSADIVYMWGVMTNLVPDHARIYTAELARIARDGGRIFLTAFVEEDVPQVSYNPSDYVPYDLNRPLTVVRYNKDWLLALFEQHGLQLDAFNHHAGMFPKQTEIYLTKKAEPSASATAAFSAAGELR